MGVAENLRAAAKELRYRGLIRGIRLEQTPMTNKWPGGFGRVCFLGALDVVTRNTSFMFTHLEESWAIVIALGLNVSPRNYGAAPFYAAEWSNNALDTEAVVQGMFFAADEYERYHAPVKVEELQRYHAPVKIEELQLVEA